MIKIYLKTADGYLIEEKTDKALRDSRDFYTTFRKPPPSYLVPLTDEFHSSPVYSQRHYKFYGRFEDGLPVYEEQF